MRSGRVRPGRLRPDQPTFSDEIQLSEKVVVELYKLGDGVSSMWSAGPGSS